MNKNLKHSLLQERTFNLADISEVGGMIHMNVMLEIKRYSLFRKSNNREQTALCAKNVIVCFWVTDNRQSRLKK